MNIMLVAVVVVSFAIGEVSTGILVALLILLNVVLGSRQELKAQASVTALSNLQVPQAKVVRDGTLVLVAAVDLVPGDIVQVEAGDIVPADGRIIRSATLETQEAALTGESAPVGKDAGVLPGADVALGDRSNMLFQNTSVTRGTASMVVTATGMQTQMGQIATMLTSVTRTRSPLQKELDSLTKVLGIIAWTAVAFIFVVGLARGMDAQELFLLGTAMAISAIPDRASRVRVGAALLGCEAARGRQGDREEPERRRDARCDERDQHRQDRHPHDERDDGVGRLRRAAPGSPSRVRDTARRARSNRSPASPVPDFTNLALGMVLDSDATVADDGAVVGDPTEAALVVLSAKLDVDAEETRRTYPRLAEVPFDSEYKFMATFHRASSPAANGWSQLVKGGPDVVLARCARAGGPLSDTHVPIDELRPDIDAANERMGEQGLRVLAFAARFVDDDELDAMQLGSDVAHAGPRFRRHGRHHRSAASRSQGSGPHRARRRHRRAHDHRRPRRHRQGHRRRSSGSAPARSAGTSSRQLSDEELARRLPQLHVFGRVSPEDKLRLARVMQDAGLDRGDDG